MSIRFTENWHQYGLIAELVLKLEGISPQFGKTVMQILIYMLQEIHQVPCGYDYNLQNCSPYSADLNSDLDFLQTLDGVKIDWIKGRGSEIKKTGKTNHFRKKGGYFLEKYKPEIDKVVTNFGRMSARDLDLHSMIIYISKEDALDKDGLIRRVKEIKPYISHGEIVSAYCRLEPYNN